MSHHIAYGICNGYGWCTDPIMNPCSVHGCRGKNCGDECLSGDVMGVCDATGNCEFNYNPDCGGMQLQLSIYLKINIEDVDFIQTIWIVVFCVPILV